MVIRNKNHWKVSEDFNKQRLDYWLKKKLSTVPYPTICQLIRKGVIKLNGKRTKNSSILSTGDLINFSRDIKEEGINKSAVTYNQKFSEFIQSLVIFKNEYSIIINKPPGLAVQGGTNIKLQTAGFEVPPKYYVVYVDNDGNPNILSISDKNLSQLLNV